MLPARILGLALSACATVTAPSASEAPDPVDSAAAWIPPGCGDGVLDADEGCDAGAANSDTAPAACRTDCFPARCGDAVVDPGEGCDDGGHLGGDGCTVDCRAETGTPEAEPNESWEQATPAGSEADGSLGEGDVDCWAFEVGDCDASWIEEVAPCSRAMLLSLHDPLGNVVATGGPEDDGCAAVDPADMPGARFQLAGTWSVCAASLTGAAIDGYALAIATADTEDLGLDVTGTDSDRDAVPDTCDADLDGDGIDNATDNCPTVSNGPATPAPALSADGYVRTWLAAGPFTGGVTTGECRPSEEPFVGEDADLAVTLGDPAGDETWTAALLGGDRFDMASRYSSAAAPREAYALVYLRDDVDETLTLSLGADDGVFAWWNGEQVLDVASCQGVVADQFQAPVEALAGWNTLLVKVRDWGGGWGTAARLLREGAPAAELEPSLVPGASWTPDQSDADGDGVGDVCE